MLRCLLLQLVTIASAQAIGSILNGQAVIGP